MTDLREALDRTRFSIFHWFVFAGLVAIAMTLRECYGFIPFSPVVALGLICLLFNLVGIAVLVHYFKHWIHKG